MSSERSDSSPGTASGSSTPAVEQPVATAPSEGQASSPVSSAESPGTPAVPPAPGGDTLTGRTRMTQMQLLAWIAGEVQKLGHQVQGLTPEALDRLASRLIDRFSGVEHAQGAVADQLAGIATEERLQLDDLGKRISDLGGAVRRLEDLNARLDHLDTVDERVFGILERLEGHLDQLGARLDGIDRWQEAHGPSPREVEDAERIARPFLGA